MSKRPSFQFYPQDWLSDQKVIIMTAAQRGIYIHLLAHMWNTDDCTLENDLEFLAQLSGGDQEDVEVVLKRFRKTSNNSSTITHKRLQAEREKQDKYRKACSDAGKLGNAKRWGGDRVPDKVAIAKDRSSSSSSSSTSVGNTPPKKKERDQSIPASVGVFLDHCEKRKIEVKISTAKYLELRDEFTAKIDFWNGVRKCIDWCYDNQKKTITAARLRNWMNKEIDWQRQAQLKQQQSYQDKKNVLLKKSEVMKPEPVWMPPV